MSEKNTLAVTIHTIIIKELDDSESPTTDVEVITTLDTHEHDRKLREIFRNNADTDSMSTKDIILGTDSILGYIDNEEELDEMDCEELVEWCVENVRPNLLIDAVHQMSYGLREVEVKYTQEYIEV